MWIRGFIVGWCCRPTHNMFRTQYFPTLSRPGRSLYLFVTNVPDQPVLLPLSAFSVRYTTTCLPRKRDARGLGFSSFSCPEKVNQIHSSSTLLYPTRAVRSLRLSDHSINPTYTTRFQTLALKCSIVTRSNSSLTTDDDRNHQSRASSTSSSEGGRLRFLLGTLQLGDRLVFCGFVLGGVGILSAIVYNLFKLLSTLVDIPTPIWVLWNRLKVDPLVAKDLGSPTFFFTPLWCGYVRDNFAKIKLDIYSLKGVHAIACGDLYKDDGGEWEILRLSLSKTSNRKDLVPSGSCPHQSTRLTDDVDAALGRRTRGRCKKWGRRQNKIDVYIMLYILILYWLQCIDNFIFSNEN